MPRYPAAGEPDKEQADTVAITKAGPPRSFGIALSEQPAFQRASPEPGREEGSGSGTEWAAMPHEDTYARQADPLVSYDVEPDVPGPGMGAAGASEIRVRIRSSADIVAARQQGRILAALIGLSSSNLTMIATAISEVGRNIVEYTKEGEIAISLISHGSRKGVKVVASDEGPGIADIATVMRDGFSTSQGLGIGLPGARRLMDDFEIASELDKGTTITMKKWL